MLPIRHTTHHLRYFDLKGFEHRLSGPTQAHLEAKLEHLIKTDQATLMNHVFSKTEEWIERKEYHNETN
jgi:hypothetical protein